MQRREFLGTGLLGVGVAGCARGAGVLDPGAPPPMSEAEVQQFLKRLDTQLALIKTAPPVTDRLVKSNPLPADLRRGSEELARKTMRTLLVAGSFSDLPLEGRVHPDVQARVLGHMPEMDAATSGMQSYLEALTPTEQSDIARAMRADPGLGMRVIEAIDVEASKIGVSLERRMHMRQLAAHICGRMKQSAGLLLDDTLRKVRKVSAQDTDVVATERRLMARLGQARFERMRDDVEAAAARWRVASTGVQTSGGYVQPAPKPGAAAITTGGILMGIGAISLAVGIAIVAASSEIAIAALVFGVTAGGLLLLAGIITLIVGLVLRSDG